MIFFAAIIIGLVLLYVLMRPTKQGSELKFTNLEVQRVAQECDGEVPPLDQEMMDALRYYEVNEYPDSPYYRLDLEEMLLTVKPGDDENQENPVREYRLRRTKPGHWEAEETEESFRRAVEYDKHRAMNRALQAWAPLEVLVEGAGLEGYRLDWALERFRLRWRELNE